jgi:hypothetical protein
LSIASNIQWYALIPHKAYSFITTLFLGPFDDVITKFYCIWERQKIKRKFNSDNTCYYSVQNLLSSRLLSKNVKIRIYNTIILPLVLYVCKKWSLILREKRRLRVFEKRVLRRRFGPKWDEVTGDSRKLHNEEHQNLYSSPGIIRMMKSRRMSWAGHVARRGDKRIPYRVLIGKPEVKRLLGR